MHSVVLAGGYGTRLWPITERRPKMLLPVGEETVLDSILRPLQHDDRIETVHLSTNDRFDDRLGSFLRGADYPKAQLSVEPTTRESEKPGAVGALAGVIDREVIADDLLVVAGDHYIDFDLSAFVSFFESRRVPSITANDVGTKAEAGSYGVIELEEGRVTEFVEKPDEPRSTLISPACYIFPAETLPLFTEYLAADTDPDAPGWFIKWLKDRRPVYAHVIDGHVVDVGTRTNYLNAVAWVLAGDSLVSDEATLREATFGGNVIVRGNASVHRSTITDSVVFSGASVRDSEVRGSIIDGGATVDGVALDGELVGTGEHLGAD